MSGRTLDELRARLGSEIRAHGVSVNALDIAVAAHLGINRTDLKCLDVLLRMGACTPSQLCVRLGLSTGSVTVMLDRLARLGYLTRTPDQEDRRKVVVRPTELAAQETGKIYGPLAEENAAHLATYTAAELELLIDFLTRSREMKDRLRCRIERPR